MKLRHLYLQQARSDDTQHLDNGRQKRGEQRRKMVSLVMKLVQLWSVVTYGIEWVVGSAVVQHVQYRIRQKSNCFNDLCCLLLTVVSTLSSPCRGGPDSNNVSSCFSDTKPSDFYDNTWNCITAVPNNRYGCIRVRSCQSNRTSRAYPKPAAQAEPPWLSAYY